MAEHPTPAPRPPWQARLPFFYGWGIVGATFITHFVQVGVQLWALSVFVGPMTGELTHWDRSDIFSAVTVRTLIAAAGVPLVGRFLDRRYGAMVLGLFSGVLGSVVLVAVARVQEPWQFMVLFGIVGGVANMGQTVVIGAAIVPKWFVRQRSRALAISTTGGGMGALVMPLVAAATIDALGWRPAWVVFGIGTALISIPLALFMRRRPEDVGLLPDGAPRPPVGAPHPAGQSSFTLREALHMRTTWLLMLAIGLASLPNTGIPTNIVPMFTDRGFSPHSAAVALSLYGLMSVTARYVWGYVASRTSVRTAILSLSLVGACASGGLILAGTNEYALWLLAAANGMAIGGMIVLTPMVWPTYLGRAHLGAITGVVFPVNALSNAAGPLVLAQAFDRTGSYSLGLGAVVIGYLAAVVVLLFVKPPGR